MTLADTLAAGRRAAEARMLDTFDIEVPDGYELVDGVEVPRYAEAGGFTTKGRVKNAGNAVRDAEAGGRNVVTVVRELHIPWNSPAVPAGAIAICTAVDATSDPTLLGARLRLDGPTPGSQTTARRMQVSEVLT